MPTTEPKNSHPIALPAMPWLSSHGRPLVTFEGFSIESQIEMTSVLKRSTAVERPHSNPHRRHPDEPEPTPEAISNSQGC